MQAGGDNRSYHGIAAGSPDAAVPLFARRILAAGEDIGAWVAALAARPQASVYAISRQTPTEDAGLERADAVLPPGTTPLPFPDRFFDAVLLYHSTVDGDTFASRVGRYAPHISDTGVLVAALPGLAPESATAALEPLGWRVHQRWAQDDTALPITVIRAYRTDCDIRALARLLYESGNAAWAYDLLYQPPEFGLDADEAAWTARDALVYLQAMGVPDAWPARLSRLARAHWLFTASASHFPDDADGVKAMASIFAQSGLETLGADLLRSFAHRQAGDRPAAVPDPVTEATPKSVPAPGATIELTAPGIRRVLLLTRLQMDYGLDTLYDGLCTVLGGENVVEYPFKPTLHGQGAADAAYYPVIFTRPGAPQPLEAIHARLAAGGFDAILFGDIGHDIPREAVLHLLAANPALPVALLDQGDSPEDDFVPLCGYLGRETIAVGFKREKVAGVPYHPRVRPLPFAYPDGRIPDALPTSRNTPLYWAGNRNVWMRRLYLEGIERRFQIQFGAVSAQAHYRERLLDAQISPCFFGGGFDTVRYWEIPAHGSLLLAERPPIEIPNNFEDGRHAIFFGCAASLEENLGYYNTHPDEAAAIAAAGHAHLRIHHTASARARQLLAELGAATE